MVTLTRALAKVTMSKSPWTSAEVYSET